MRVALGTGVGVALCEPDIAGLGARVGWPGEGVDLGTTEPPPGEVAVRPELVALGLGKAVGTGDAVRRVSTVAAG